MQHEIKEYSGNLIIRLTLDDGKQYEFRASKDFDTVEIRTIDGRMVINPSVSNVIKITTAKD